MHAWQPIQIDQVNGTVGLKVDIYATGDFSDEGENYVELFEIGSPDLLEPASLSCDYAKLDQLIAALIAAKQQIELLSQTQGANE